MRVDGKALVRSKILSINAVLDSIQVQEYAKFSPLKRIEYGRV